MSRTVAGSLAVLAAGLWMASCGSSGGGNGYGSTPTGATATPTPTPSATADVVITISGFAFSPASASVSANQTVAWKNMDSVSHTATADGGAFDTGMIASGATSKPMTITASGALKYHCQVHPGMVATLNGPSGSTGPGY